MSELSSSEPNMKSKVKSRLGSGEVVRIRGMSDDGQVVRGSGGQVNVS